MNYDFIQQKPFSTGMKNAENSVIMGIIKNELVGKKQLWQTPWGDANDGNFLHSLA